MKQYPLINLVELFDCTETNKSDLKCLQQARIVRQRFVNIDRFTLGFCIIKLIITFRLERIMLRKGLQNTMTIRLKMIFAYLPCLLYLRNEVGFCFMLVCSSHYMTTFSRKYGDSTCVTKLITQDVRNNCGMSDGENSFVEFVYAYKHHCIVKLENDQLTYVDKKLFPMFDQLYDHFAKSGAFSAVRKEFINP